MLCGFGLLAACTTADEVRCLVRHERGSSAALTQGTADAEYLKLEPRQQDSVIAIVADGALWCSGALVSEHHVLTAQHCMEQFDPAALEVVFGGALDEAAFRTAARISRAHPDLDLLVLELAGSPVAAIGVEPLPVAARPIGALAPGTVVQIAGFGGGGETARTREFLVAEVTASDRASVTVSAGGLGGACFGDSGGPLLLRTATGEAAVLGVLTEGSSSCSGFDVYARADGLADWLAGGPPDGGADAGLDAGAERTYERLGVRGRCFGATPVWNEDGRLEASACQNGSSCGWDERAGGYRCVEVDPCHGVSDVGRCEQGSALQCRDGKLARNACTACGFTCTRSPETGAAICLAPSSARDGGSLRARRAAKVERSW